MITTWLPTGNIQIVDSVSDWKQAITLSAQPLLAKEAITEDYIKAIFNSHQKIGSYYVLAPGLAMPHARPEQGTDSDCLWCWVYYCHRYGAWGDGSGRFSTGSI